jgi:two-component system, response regulator
MNSPRILVVEDSPAQAELLSRAFDHHGLGGATRLEHGIDSALAFLRRQLNEGPASLPRLLLIDLRLSQGSGLELLRQVRADRTLAYLPVIMLTTSDDPTDIGASYSGGVNGYVVKPSSFEDLLVLIRDLCTYWLKWNQTAPPSLSAHSDQDPRSPC